MNIRKLARDLTHPSVVLSMVLILSACGSTPAAPQETLESTRVDSTSNTTSSEYQVVISGGYETDPRDNGRPVVLIASMLGVTPEVFREAFSHVQPAKAGTQPQDAQVRQNKAALLTALAHYGVTNDYLDTVSNYYRYNRSAGETWTQHPAVIEAVVSDGIVTGFDIIDAGSGYTSAPGITVVGSDVSVTGVLSFTNDFVTNGSITEIVLDK